MGAEYEALLYRTEVRWLTKNQSLSAYSKKGRNVTFSEKKRPQSWNNLKEGILSMGWLTWQIYLII
jgi:hypothetical protein